MIEIKTFQNKNQKYFSLEGIVQKGTKTQTTIGFPTLNLVFDSVLKSLPQIGCYITLTQIAEKYYFGLTCCIKNKANKFLCETWLENFSQSFYGKKIKVFFIRFYRQNKPFVSILNIQKLIQKDLKELSEKPRINIEFLK